MRHGSMWRHVKAWAWIYLRTDRSRFRYIDRIRARRPDLCWCGLVDAWWRATEPMLSDYQRPYGCVCDFPLPRDCYQPRPTQVGICYCPVTVEERAMEAEARSSADPSSGGVS